MRITILFMRTIASFALAALAVPFLWSTVSGDYYMTVTGVSMRPTYELGDVLVVQQAQGDELQTVGAPVIVSFIPGERTDQYVHRVHEITPEGAILKGDGNEIVDPAPVTQEQVLGTPRIVLQGNVATLFRLSELWAVRLIVGAFFLIALFIPSRPRGRRTAEADETNYPRGAEQTGERAAAQPEDAQPDRVPVGASHG